MVLWILGTPNGKKENRIVQNLPLFTYVIGFEKIYPTDITSDIGWGCTIRSGQMLLANGILSHLLGINWKRSFQQH